MIKRRNLRKTTQFIKIFTHISAVVILLMTNSLIDIPVLLSFVGGILLASYLRLYLLSSGTKTEAYKWISFSVEMALIIVLGFFDKSNSGAPLFFFVCISEAAIYYDLKYSVIFMLPFLISRYFVGAIQTAAFPDRLLYVLLMYGVPTVFVFGMSYIVRIQIREKDRLAKINAELEDAYKTLLETAAVSEQLSIEKERLRMAREIHDTLAHTLTSVIVQLEACRRLSQKDIGRLEDELAKAQEMTRSGLNDVKRTIKSLRPQALEEKPFFESVLDLVNNTMNLAGAHIIFDNSLPAELKLPPGHEVAIFRLIQESMTNAIRHGKATEIYLSMSMQSHMIHIDIRDNGVGCPRIKKGFGLRGIEERMQAMGGTAVFSSAADAGFATHVTIPQGGPDDEN